MKKLFCILFLVLSVVYQTLGVVEFSPGTNNIRVSWAPVYRTTGSNYFAGLTNYINSLVETTNVPTINMLGTTNKVISKADKIALSSNPQLYTYYQYWGSNAPVAGYRVYWDTENPLDSVVIDVGTNTSVVLTNLSEFEKNRISVTWYNLGGLESMSSAPIIIPEFGRLHICLDGPKPYIWGNMSNSLPTTLQFSDNLKEWKNIATFIITNCTLTYTDTSAATNIARFYRCYTTVPGQKLK